MKFLDFRLCILFYADKLDIFYLLRLHLGLAKSLAFLVNKMDSGQLYASPGSDCNYSHQNDQETIQLERIKGSFVLGTV